MGKSCTNSTKEMTYVGNLEWEKRVNPNSDSHQMKNVHSYIRLNQATQNDNFLLPFVDQMLEKLVGQTFYYFLYGYSSYNQITVNHEDHEKT